MLINIVTSVYDIARHSMCRNSVIRMSPSLDVLAHCLKWIEIGRLGVRVSSDFVLTRFHFHPKFSCIFLSHLDFVLVSDDRELVNKSRYVVME